MSIKFMTPPIEFQTNVRTPWGVAQQVLPIAEGIVEVSTAGHGGIRLSAERRQQLPAVALACNFFKSKYYGTGEWWEEDCDWAIPFLFFADDFKLHYEQTDPSDGGDRYIRARDAAMRLTQEYHPAFYAWWVEASSQLSLFS